MRKIFTSCLVSIFSVTLAFGTVVTTSVTFGKGSRGCSGLGVCSTETKKSGQSDSKWEYIEDQNTLKLSIPEQEIDQNPEQIANGHFTQEEDFILPTSLCRQLGALGTLTIRRGSYNVSHVGSWYIISFPVQQS